jgi:hypothetical protein
MPLLRWLLLSLLIGSLLSCAGISSKNSNGGGSGGSGSGGGSGSSGETGAAFFGMQMNTGVLNQQPWPTSKFGTLRLWDTSTTWAEINTAPGVYGWSVLDHWLSMAQSHGINDFMYTFGKTPQWASSNPSDASCLPDWGPGACDPPDDLNPDGTGTDQHWKDFVTAVATHSGGKIRYWEIWNEPLDAQEWTGTAAQVATMAKDARSIILSIDPKAVMLSPPSEGTWFRQYVAAGGVRYADVVTFHGYPGARCGAFPDPANVINRVNGIQTILSAAGITGKALWDTEASWGNEQANCFTDQDSQAAFLAQFYLLHLSEGVSRFYWYQWNNGIWGTLWSPDPAPNGTMLQSGTAYQQVYDWVVGNSLAAPCTSSGTQWTCTFTGPGGYQAEAIWDTSQSCGNGSCSTLNVSIDSKYIRAHDLTGSSTAVANHSVAVGLKPVLVTNQ